MVLYFCLFVYRESFRDMSLLFDQERRLPPDPARLPHDPARLPHDPARLQHDPARLSHDPVRLPHDPVRLPHDPARLPHDPARLPHDPARLPHNPARLPADSVRLAMDSPGSSHPGSSAPSFKVLQDARPPPAAAVADFRPLAAVTASAGWPQVAPPPHYTTLTSQGAESTRSSTLHMLEGGGAQLIDSRPLVPEPVVRPPPAVAARDEPGRPLPFMDESQVILPLG